MAIAADAQNVVRDDRQFFVVSAWIMAAVIVLGFSINLAFGRSSFALPIPYHVHAIVFFGWIALYLMQTTLAGTGQLALHRRLGWLAAGWVPLMTIVGLTMVFVAIRRRGAPFFFDQNEFLLCNIANLLVFAAIAAFGLAMRRRTDWHRRLMFCATAAITGPGWGRILPGPLMIPWAFWIVGIIMPALFFLVAIWADHERAGRIHPALWTGLAMFLGGMLLAEAIAYSPAGYALTNAVIAGTPGSARPMHAYLP